MTMSLVCIALLGLLVFGLGFAVSLTRGRTSTNWGYDADPENRLYKLVRAHGNATEYAPMLAVLIFLVGMGAPQTWALWAAGIGVASRYVHAFGVITGRTLDAINPFRFAGSLGTYLAGLALSIAVILSL